MDTVYKQEVQQYGKKDAAIALGVFLFWNVWGIVWWGMGISDRLFDWDALSGQNASLLTSLEQFVGAVPVILFLLISKQGLASIGIHKERLLPALRFTLTLAIIPFVFAILPGLLYGGEFVGFGPLLFGLLAVFIFAASEDIVFVGFIQTRLSGFFKSDRIAVAVGATAFALMHVPNWLRTGQLSFDNPVGFVFTFAVWLTFHYVFVAIFKRHFSLIAIMLLHTVYNWSDGNRFWILPDEYAGYVTQWNGLGMIVLFLVVGIWVFISHRKTKKH